MATVITAQPNNLWQRQPDVYINIPFMGMSDFQPTCGTFKTYTNPILSRTFQEGPSVGSTMSTYSSNPMGKSMPYHPSGIPFDSVLANTYTLPPHFPIRYANPVGFQTTASVQSSPPVRHERQQVASESNPRPGPVVKVETSSPVQSSNVLSELPVKDTCEQTSTPRANFNTHIDTLMKAIQAKQKSDPSRQLPPKEEDGCGGHRRRLIKRHQCAIEGCDKRFAQRTHLQIHIRSHTGEKPFLCKHVGCGEGFSQLGNLKSHERRHTGEKPFMCEICGRRFPQRGNVRTHMITHEQVKPYVCELNGCGKQFTTLGNLKSHQNKFHAADIRILTEKFSSIQGSDEATSEEKRLWEYFASLYKNANKGIKGRGTNRRIARVSSSAPTSAYPESNTAPAHTNYAHVYQQSGSDRSSRSPSMLSDAPPNGGGYDFSTSLVDGYPANSSTYGDLVFPERKLF